MRKVNDEVNEAARAGCPSWCAREHEADEHPDDAWHRSRVWSPAVVAWPVPSTDAPSAGVVHVSLVQHVTGGELRLRLESDGRGSIDLDPGSAARVSAAVSAALGLLAEAR